MTKDEALKMALEALEQIQSAMPFPSAINAIKMCREALAQKDEQELVAVGEIVQSQAVRDVGGAYTGLGYPDGYVTDIWKDVEFYTVIPNDKRRWALQWNEALEVGTKLYTATPKRKPRLTDEQIMDCCGTPAACADCAAAVAIAGEREACAKVMDNMAAQDKHSNYYRVAAKAIRARGNT